MSERESAGEKDRNIRTEKDRVIWNLVNLKLAKCAIFFVVKIGHSVVAKFKILP